MPERLVARLVPVVAGLGAALAFLPSLLGDFVNWDDETALVNNPAYRGLGPVQLRWMWTTFSIGMYRPLTWMTYGADYLLWGMRPFGYHLVNVLLHALVALVVYRLSHRLLELGRSDSPERHDRVGLALAAGVAALFFAIHPLRAEAVAWVSGRGDLLAALLALLATLAYLRAVAPDPSRTDRTWLLTGALLFALSLLSKPTHFMLPLGLLVLDVYPLRRFPVGRPARAGWRLFWEKTPFLALALAAAPLHVIARTQPGGTFRWDPLVGLALAAHSLTFYARKTFLLGPLSPFYEKPQHLDPLAGPFAWSGLAVVGISLGLVLARRRWPAGLAAWLFYAVMLLPSSGIVPFARHLAADRYAYVPGLGWAVLVGAGALVGWQAWRSGRVGTPATALIAALALIGLTGLSVLTWHQVQVWRASKTLWTHALLVDSRSGVAHNNLAAVLEREGKLTDAIAHYRLAVWSRPGEPLFFANLGLALVARGRQLARDGRAAEALEPLQEALRVRPDLVEAHLALASALVSQRRLDEAVAHYRTALRLGPGLAEARAGLADALRQLEAGRAEPGP